MTVVVVVEVVVMVRTYNELLLGRRTIYDFTSEGLKQEIAKQSLNDECNENDENGWRTRLQRRQK